MIELYSVCGDWKFKSDKTWEFVIDCERGSSLSVIKEDITFNELILVVAEDFGIDCFNNLLKLSYGLSSSFLTSSKDVPPIVIRNYRQVKSFVNKFQETSEVVKLCVTVSALRGKHNAVDISKAITSPVSDQHTVVEERETNTIAVIDENNILISNDTQSVSVTFNINEFPKALLACSDKHITSNMLEEERELNLIAQESSGTKRKKLSTFKASSDPIVVVNVDSSGSCADTSDKISVGDLFKDKSELQSKIQLLSMRESFEFKPQFLDKSRYVIKCVDPNCSWKLRAIRVEGSNGFVIMKYINEHQCDTSMRNINHRQAKAKILGIMVSNHFDGGKLGLKPKQIMETIRKDHGVQISYQKAWRAQEHAQELARGDCDESYGLLPKWFHMVNVKNPGSATYLELDKYQRFKYAFLAFGASLRGFKLMKKVVVVDGTFLKSKYKGTLLGASAQDGNLQ